jgi:hypothetical protein
VLDDELEDGVQSRRSGATECSPDERDRRYVLRRLRERATVSVHQPRRPVIALLQQALSTMLITAIAADVTGVLRPDLVGLVDLLAVEMGADKLREPTRVSAQHSR